MFNIFSYIFGSSEPVTELQQAVSDNQAPIVSANVTKPVNGNDSGDIAEMDESWYVTPPPCFTGADKLNETKPKPKSDDAAARENALIEHPSIYIASSSKQQTPPVFTGCSTNESIAIKKPIVLRKANKVQPKMDTKLANENLASIVKPFVKLEEEEEEEKKKENQEDSLDKFEVINWDDEMEDGDDFDNLFETGKTSIVGGIEPVSKIEPETEPLPEPAIEPEISGSEQTELPPAEVNQFDDSSNNTASLLSTYEEEIQNVPTIDDDNVERAEVELATNENIERLAKEKRPPVQVRPLKPERQPGWQLKRRRSKRQPMSPNSANVGKPTDNDSDVYGSSSNSSSERASPLMNERMRSPIVANLNHLTNGLATTVLPMRLRSSALDEAERMNQSVSKKMETCSVMASRKRMSKGYLDRQNGCAKEASSRRRADRRKKMYTTPNGYSVNRKVHTSIH